MAMHIFHSIQHDAQSKRQTKGLTFVMRPTEMFVCLCLALFSLTSTDALSAKAKTKSSTISVEDKTKAENQKADVESKLHDLESSLHAKESEKEAANAELQKADTSISEANKKLRQLEQDRRRIEKEIQALRRNESSVGKDLSSASNTLDLIAKTQFVTLQKPAWQALLNGQNPNQIYRDSAMLSYLAGAQQKALQDLESLKKQIRSVTLAAQSQQEELLKIKRAEEEQRQILFKEKRDRENAVKKLGNEIQSQQTKIESLKKDQLRLSNLVNTIDAKLKKQAEEERKRQLAEQQAAERLAKEKARRDQQAQQQAQQNKKKILKPETTTPAPVLKFTGKQLPGFKGKLTRPVNGRVTASFGQARDAAGRSQWQGIQLSAAEGTEVIACAEGRVVFADWLRGYGNLIIIDHGKGYLSVYGNNESLFKNVGDYVKQGETISAVGSSGGNSEPGLYFELRHNGKPINPAPWL